MVAGHLYRHPGEVPGISARAGNDPNQFGLDLLSAFAADEVMVELPATTLVGGDRGGTVLGRVIPVAPPHQLQQDGGKLAALGSESILEPGRLLAVRMLLEDAVLDQGGETGGEDAAGDA